MQQNMLKQRHLINPKADYLRYRNVYFTKALMTVHQGSMCI